LRFNQIKRSKGQRRVRGGFTLLETLIAFSILMVVLGTVYATAISMTRRSHSANDRRALSELAYSVLTEFTTTYPNMPSRGTFGSIYQWDVTETSYPVDGSEQLIGARYLEIEARVWRMQAPEIQQSIRTLLAIRATP
jgi:type II secretory pathway pseudopilin PulG